MRRINLIITSFAVAAFVICLWAASTSRAEAQKTLTVDQCRENYFAQLEECSRRCGTRDGHLNGKKYDQCVKPVLDSYSDCMKAAGRPLRPLLTRNRVAIFRFQHLIDEPWQATRTGILLELMQQEGHEVQQQNHLGTGFSPPKTLLTLSLRTRWSNGIDVAI